MDGKNIRQEITRWFNQLWNLFKRKKNEKLINKIS